MDLTAAEQMANELMQAHQLTPKWSFRFDRAKVRFGRCNYSNKEITLSQYLVQLNDEPEVRDTILHEIAHALAPRGVGHSAAWQVVAQSIGCNAQRCYGEDVVRPAPKHKGTCPACRRVIYRHRRALIACGRCSPIFDSKFAFVWS